MKREVNTTGPFLALFLGLVAALLWITVASAAAVPVPVEPGRAAIGQFDSATGCSCHRPLVQEWSQSMHAQALSDPIFRAKLEQADKATGGKLGPFCLKCHGPNATMVGEVSSADMSDSSAEGITCMFCHQVVGLAAGEPGNTSHLLEVDGTRRAQLKDPQASHPAVYSEIHERSEICGGCHNVNHPINGMHLESTYREWAEGPYAKEGVACQDCHMSVGPGVRGPSSGTAAMGGPTRDNIYHMTFVGAQVELGPSETATARLKNSATVAIDAPQIVQPGAEASVTVTTTNTGAGHYLPTGLTEVREMWLEITVTQPSGETSVVGEHRFGTILEDAEGRSPAELWDAVAIKSDDRIAPRASVKDSFVFEMPAGDATTVSAALYYRSVPDELAKDAGVKNPTTTMASAESKIFTSEKARTGERPVRAAEGPARAPLWMIGVIALIVLGAGLWLWSRSSRAGTK